MRPTAATDLQTAPRCSGLQLQRWWRRVGGRTQYIRNFSFFFYILTTTHQPNVSALFDALLHLLNILNTPTLLSVAFIQTQRYQPTTASQRTTFPAMPHGSLPSLSVIAAPSQTHLVTQQCPPLDPMFPPPAAAFNEVNPPLPSARGRMRMNKLANDPRVRRTTTRESRRGREAGMGKRRRGTRGEGKVPGTFQPLPLPTPLTQPITRKTSADKAKKEAAAKAAAKCLK